MWRVRAGSIGGEVWPQRTRDRGLGGVVGLSLCSPDSLQSLQSTLRSRGVGGRGERCRHSTPPHTGEHSHRLLLSISMLRHAMSQCSNPASWIAIKPSAASHTIRTLVTQSNAWEPLTLPASLCQQLCGGECDVPVSKPQQQHRTWIEWRPPSCLLAGTALQAWVLSAVVHH